MNRHREMEDIDENRLIKKAVGHPREGLGRARKEGVGTHTILQATWSSHHGMAPMRIGISGLRHRKMTG